MKKTIIASIIAISASTAFAGAVTAEYQAADGQYGTAGNTALVLNVEEYVAPNISIDIGGTNTQTNSASQLSTRIEAGVTYFKPVGPVVASVRVGAGEKYTSGANTEYWSIEPAVSYNLTEKLSAKVGYRYSTAVDSRVADQTRTFRVGTEYAITKDYGIGARLEQVRGDTSTNVIALTVTHSF